MFTEAWSRRRAARWEARCLRDIAKLSSRASLREAEEIVASSWIEHLSTSGGHAPMPPERLARECEAHAEAARERSAESARDLRRLAGLVAQITERRQEAHHVG